jgi:hypothetical protein
MQQKGRLDLKKTMTIESLSDRPMGTEGGHVDTATSPTGILIDFGPDKPGVDGLKVGRKESRELVSKSAPSRPCNSGAQLRWTTGIGSCFALIFQAQRARAHLISQAGFTGMLRTDFALRVSLAKPHKSPAITPPPQFSPHFLSHRLVHLLCCISFVVYPKHQVSQSKQGVCVTLRSNPLTPVGADSFHTSNFLPVTPASQLCQLHNHTTPHPERRLLLLHPQWYAENTDHDVDAMEETA